jgi:hypothetical protein
MKVTDARPLGKKWVGLTASMLKPVPKPDQEGTALAASKEGGNSWPMRSGGKWTIPGQKLQSASGASMLAGEPRVDVPKRSALAAAAVEAAATAADSIATKAVPADQDADNTVLVGSVEAEDVLTGPLGQAVRAAAIELAAKTGISTDAVLDRAVSLVLQERNAPSWRPGSASAAMPEDSELGLLLLEDGGPAPLRDSLAVPPEAGPEEAGVRGIFGALTAAAGRGAEAIAGALKGGSAALRIPETLWEGHDDDGSAGLPRINVSAGMCLDEFLRCRKNSIAHTSKLIRIVDPD